jgi:flotillin
MDLTNMVIDVSATGAYSKGGVPLTVQGVANVKIAGHAPLLNNAAERFLGKARPEIIQIIKDNLEGALRGVLATMTPEEVNEDKLLFAERLVHEVEEDMTRLGLVVDTLKIQNVHDEAGYLDSIGRGKNAQLISRARIAEARAKAEAVVRAAENREREVRAQVESRTAIAKAEAAKKLVDIRSREQALVAEELAQVAAQVAQSKAEVKVQEARIEQVRGRLQADVVKPAIAQMEAAEAEAKALVAPIIEDGKARADALSKIADNWGPNARDVLVLQKLEPIITAVVETISNTQIDRITMVDGSAPALPPKALSMVEQLNSLFGVDVVEMVKAKLAEKPASPGPVISIEPPPPPQSK